MTLENKIALTKVQHLHPKKKQKIFFLANIDIGIPMHTYADVCEDVSTIIHL